MSQSNGQQTVYANGWTNLGTGPLTVNLISLVCSVNIVVSDSQPADSAAGTILSGQRHTFSVNSAQPVWARAMPNWSNSAGAAIVDVLQAIPLVNINNPTATIAQVSSRDASGNANGIPGNPFYSVNVEAGTPWSYAAASGGITTATSVALAAADASGRSNYLRKLQLINTGTTATEVYVANSATAIWRIKLPASMAAPVSITFDDFELVTSANTALNFYVVTAGAAVYVNAQGFLK